VVATQQINHKIHKQSLCTPQDRLKFESCVPRRFAAVFLTDYAVICVVCFKTVGFVLKFARENGETAATHKSAKFQRRIVPHHHSRDSRNSGLQHGQSNSRCDCNPA